MRGTTTACLRSSLPAPPDRETLGTCHIESLRQLAALPVPPAPSVYDTKRELAWVFHGQVIFLRQIVDLIEPVFMRAADDAADFGGVRVESFDLIRGAIEDFVAPITVAAEQIDDE
jgi:hypothetical protein